MTPTNEGQEAFCQTCPDPERVTQLLQKLGFQLTFQMDGFDYPAWAQMPRLPAQFHFRDAQNTEVIYLAGHDANTDDIHLPDHASRFWLYPGKHTGQHQLVRRVLASWWNLNWQPIVTDDATTRGVA